MKGMHLAGIGAALLLTLVAAGQLQSAAADGERRTVKAASLRLPDTEGKMRTLADFAGRKLLVVAFTGIDCPISNSYSPLLSELAKRYASRGVQFIGVNSNPGESLDKVAQHRKEYRLAFPVLKDDQQELAELLQPRVTPEVFVVDQDRKVRYRGRIDDQYASRTEKAARVKSRDLEQAIEAVLAGRAVAQPVTQAFGCAIVRREKQAAAPAIGFHRDVEPILQERCQSCHRPGQIAPFSLLSYDDAKKWAAEIAEFTGNRQMPPWKAEPGYGHFRDVRRMSDQEIATVARWVDAGAPRGNPADAPKPRQWSDEWALGKPDLVLKMPEAFSVEAAGDDIFRCFAVPTGLDKDMDVVAVEIRPGNPRVVHHVLNFLDTTGAGRRLDEKDPGPGYSSGPGGVGFFPSGALGGWAPGNMPRFLPDGVGMKLPKGSDLVIQVHYHKTGKPEIDQTQIGIHFARKPVEKYMAMIPVTNMGIKIPAGAARHEVPADIKSPWNVRVLSVTPHMHLLGKEMKVWATLPDGSEKELVWIKDWDYRWQDTYYFKEPLELPKGTTVHMRAYFDNSEANPRNPNSPPKLVTFGEQTTDEMAFAFLEIVRLDPPNAADALIGGLLNARNRQRAAEAAKPTGKGSP